MSLSGRLGAILAIGIAAVLAVGCGETLIDHTKAEALLKENIHPEGTQVASVDCPSDVKVEKGEIFRCSVKLANGGEETATVKVVNDSADIAIVSVKPTK